jgi:hypothetical protein
VSPNDIAGLVGAAPLKRRPFYPATELRAFRLTHGVRLVDAAYHADIPPARVSLVERDPALARPGEVEQLRRAIELASRDSTSVSASEPLKLAVDSVTK